MVQFSGRAEPFYGDRPVTEAIIGRITQGLAALTLPKIEWTHEAHLIAAGALLEERGLRRAEEEMPDMIRHYNTATGVINSDTDGYHHTITLFYLRGLADFLDDYQSGTLVEKMAAVLASPLADRGWLFNFYSKELLFCVEARRGWVEPDLKALKE